MTTTKITKPLTRFERFCRWVLILSLAGVAVRLLWDLLAWNWV